MLSVLLWLPMSAHLLEQEKNPFLRFTSFSLIDLVAINEHIYGNDF